MPYDIQTGALLPYVLLAVAYLGILFFPRKTRDPIALALLVTFCFALGLRNVDKMPAGADAVIYADILSKHAVVPNAPAGLDYSLLLLLHNITGSLFGLNASFLILHLLYIPVLFCLYWSSRRFHGMFYLLTGWMLFLNSGVLLLANFFRQGLSVFLFLVLLIWFSRPLANKWAGRIGALMLPFLHLGSTALIPALFTCKGRRFYYVFAVFFILFCCGVWLLSASLGSYFELYLQDVDQRQHQIDLLLKVLLTYCLLIVGYWLRPRSENEPEGSEHLQRTVVGFLLPTAALLLTYGAPIIGLRYLYYSHAVAFMYIACVLGSRKGVTLGLGAVGLCSFGAVTWTYPTVSRLLVW